MNPGSYSRELTLFEEAVRDSPSIAPNARPYYRNWVEGFLRWCSEHDVSVRAPKGLRQWLDELGSRRTADWQVRQAQRAVELFWRTTDASRAGGAPAQTWEEVWKLVEEEMRLQHYSRRTLLCYRGWIRRFARFVGQRRPSELQDQDIRAYLTHLAVTAKVSAKTQNQALHALVFLVRRLLGRPVDHLEGVIRAPERRRLPQVVSREDVRCLLSEMSGLTGLMSRLCYGCGLRLSECVSLRVKDVDLHRRQLTVRQGKGDKDRTVPLPRVVISSLRDQLDVVARQHERDQAAGLGRVELPDALERKLPGADRELAWQWIFPATRPTVYADGVVRRPHRHPSVLQRAVRKAARRAGIGTRVTVHTLRHSFATHLLEDGVNIRRLQELLGHSSLQTTMVYTHVRSRPLEAGDFSPLDRL